MGDGRHSASEGAATTAESAQAKRANGGAFACIAAAWQAHHAELLGYLARRLRNKAAADDLLHDVFVKAMRQGQGFCTLDNPRAWLFQVARHALVDSARAAHTTEPLPEATSGVFDTFGAFDTSSLLEPAAPEPPSVAPVDELAGCVSRCLAELRPEDAAMLRACDLQGQTVRAFADTHGLTLAAAKSRLLRARQRLRTQLTTACQVRFADDGRVDGHVPRPSL